MRGQRRIPRAPNRASKALQNQRLRAIAMMRLTPGSPHTHGVRRERARRTRAGDQAGRRANVRSQSQLQPRTGSGDPARLAATTRGSRRHRAPPSALIAARRVVAVAPASCGGGCSRSEPVSVAGEPLPPRSLERHASRRACRAGETESNTRRRWTRRYAARNESSSRLYRDVAVRSVRRCACRR